MEFVGLCGLLFGLLIVCAVLANNDYGKIKWRVWSSGEQVQAIGGAIGVFLGFLLFVFGCGGSSSEVGDQTHVEVTACEPTLGGTAGQYYQLADWRTEVGICEAAMSEVGARQAARDAAERDVSRLGAEFDVYHATGRTDCYCGPVCLEMTKFLEEARQNGFFCRP